MQLDYLGTYARKLDYDAIQALRAERQAWFARQTNRKFEDAMNALPPLKTEHVELGDTIRIGHVDELTPKQHETLEASLKTLLPWRKGPFDIFGHEIDAEWRSDWKWNRILPHVAPLKGKRVADIGCNNGYYMFRMAEHEPRLVVGLDPTARYWYTFQFLQRFAQLDPLYFELLGIEHMHHYKGFFDVVFCLGVLYHHPDPIGMLRGLWQSLKPGGQLIVDSLGIPGEGDMALFPEKRYAKVPGTWFVPTRSCLNNWVYRSGFRDLNPFFGEKLSTDEQRKTVWAPFESLSDFLDPDDPELTVEGYPAPWRFYLTAKKPLH